MIEKYYEALQKRENLRENLVGLRAQIKDEAAKEQFVSMIGDGGLLLELLEEEDPKVRKNVAMILGELEWMGAADALVTAYEREQTLFVKSTYLKALAYLDITAYQERFKTRMEELLSYTPAAEEKKHIDEEVRALSRLLEKAEESTGHTFTGFKNPHEMLLLTGHARTDVTLKEIGVLPADIRRKTAKHPLGVAVYTKDVRAMANLRTYRELLFPIRLKQEAEQAEVLADMEIETVQDMEKAAEVIGTRYGCSVLLKGGHQKNDASDLLWQKDKKPVWFHGVRIDNPNTHGTGCTLSSAIASNLAKGRDLETSVEAAKRYISGALAAMLDLGSGSGPMNHGFAIKEEW